MYLVVFIVRLHVVLGLISSPLVMVKMNFYTRTTQTGGNVFPITVIRCVASTWYYNFIIIINRNNLLSIKSNIKYQSYINYYDITLHLYLPISIIYIIFRPSINIARLEYTKVDIYPPWNTLASCYYHWLQWIAYSPCSFAIIKCIVPNYRLTK